MAAATTSDTGDSLAVVSDRREAVSVSRAAVRLAVAVALLASLAAAVGVAWTGGAAPETAVTVRGDTVTLHGSGLYRFDSAHRGPVNQGTDLVALVLWIPLLLYATILYRRGSLRGALLLLAALLWVWYLHLSLAVGVAYNELFLVYALVVAASGSALALVWRSVEIAAVERRLSPSFPDRAASGFLAATALVTVLLWGGLAVAALLQGAPPAHLEHASTTVEEALSLGILVPLFVFTSWSLRRGRRAVGVVLSVPLLVFVAGLAPVVTAQTIAQAVAGVPLAVEEVVGLVAAWIVLGAIAAALVVRALRSVEA